MTISRNISVMAQGASSSGILAGGYGGLGASVAPTTAGNVLFTTDGSVWSSTAKIVQGSAVSASGTSVSFTGIPSWVKRITLTIQGISTTGSSAIQVQLGTGGTPTYVTSGYLSAASSTSQGATPTTTNNTGGFSITPGGQATTAVYNGGMILVNSSGTNWVEFGSTGRSDATVNSLLGGSIALGATLTALRITTILGTPTFTAGTFNILYE
jgi:hypothetical protein